MNPIIKKPQLFIWGIIPYLLLFAALINANTPSNRGFANFEFVFLPYAVVVLFLTGLGLLLLQEFGKRQLNWATFGQVIFLMLWVISYSGLKIHDILNTGIVSKNIILFSQFSISFLFLSYCCFLINIVAGIFGKPKENKDDRI